MSSQHNDDLPPQWKRVSSSLRNAGAGERPPNEDLSAPHGFAGRVVSRFTADQRADSAGLGLWRRWSLAGAACAVALFGGSFFLKPAPEPAQHLVPVPALEELPSFSDQ